MTYSECGHDIPLRLVTKESVHLLPPTLQDQGHIPPRCAGCQRKRLFEQSEVSFQQAAQSFEDARQRFHESGGDDGVGQALLAARDRFETLLPNEVYLTQLTTWLTSW
ncbi:hypothetical protein QQX98_008371 [Neonectria punicea]|uniref:Uncharacterized protein n=1 Tax=Neonectria punicea TaxID=979145 RepID=A0ABR1GWI0_9HYPO